jgi:hypothetical protein
MSIPRKWGGDVGTKTPAQSIYEASTTQLHRIGTRLKIGERTFYYGKAAASCSPAEICAPAVSTYMGSTDGLLPDASCVALAAGTAFSDQPAITAAIAVGDRWLAVTHADMLDNVTKNMLQDGYVLLTDSANADYHQIYKIKRNSAIASDIVAIELYDPIVTVTVDATTSVALMMNPFMNLIPADATVSEALAGIPLVEIAASSYGWFQTWGPGMIQIADAAAMAGCKIQLDDTPGQGVASNTNTLPSFGYGLLDVTSYDADAGLINIQIYP